MFVSRSVALALFAFSLSACVTTPSSTRAERDAYLAQFVGQSSQQIRQQLDLSLLGYEQVSSPQISPQALTYTVIRPISIPIPVANAPATGPAHIPAPIGPANSYDVNLHCQIVFRLEQNIARSVHYSGRTC